MAERVAVVTGAASGIGRATCLRLRSEGMRVAALDVDHAGAAEVADLAVKADVSSDGNVQPAVDEVLGAFGRIDVLINNAGITGSAEATRCHSTPVEEWDRVFAVNARGPFLCARAVLPGMLARGVGHIVNIASAAGLVAFPDRCAYTASKGAALQLARSIAVDYGGLGIRANAVCPGMVETPMTQWRLADPELRAKAEGSIPMGRVATSEEVADVVALLASERLAYVNGSALVVDGGWTAW